MDKLKILFKASLILFVISLISFLISIFTLNGNSLSGKEIVMVIVMVITLILCITLFFTIKKVNKCQKKWSITCIYFLLC